jgi:hypothetical protein
MTTVYAWRKENIEAQIAQRRQLDTTIQQLIDAGFKNFEFLAKNRNDPNIGSMTGWFYSQTGMLAQKAAQELTLSKNGSLIDYLVVGNALLEAGQSSKATDLFQRAVQIGQAKQAEENTYLRRFVRLVERTLYGEDFDQIITDEQRPHHMASAHTAVGIGFIAQNKLKEAAVQFDAAILAIESSNSPQSYKKQVSATVHRSWAETLARYNYSCVDVKAQWEKAEQLYPDDLKIGSLDWNMIQIQLDWLKTHCGADGKILVTVFPPVQPSNLPESNVEIFQSAPAVNNSAAASNLPQNSVQIFQSAQKTKPSSAAKATPKPKLIPSEPRSSTSAKRNSAMPDGCDPSWVMTPANAPTLAPPGVDTVVMRPDPNDPCSPLMAGTWKKIDSVWRKIAD